MGYPSLTEALEHLSELRASRTPEPSLREALVEAREVLFRLLDYTLFHDSSLVEHEVESKQSPIVTASKRALATIDSALSASPAEPEEATEAICEHDWHYLGTDRGGSHKGEDAYKCHKCGKYEYQP